MNTLTRLAVRRLHFAVFAALLAVVFLSGIAAALDVNDVRNLIKNKVPEDAIINMVKNEGTIYITPEEAKEFRSLGASDKLITALRPTPTSLSTPTVVTSLPSTSSISAAAPTSAAVSESVAVTPAATVSGHADGTPIFPVAITMTAAFPQRYDKEGWLSIFNRDWVPYYFNIDQGAKRIFVSRVPNGGIVVQSGENLPVNLRKEEYKLYGDSGRELKIKIRENESTSLSLNPFGVFGNSGLTGVATDRERTRSAVLFDAYVPTPPTVIIESPPPAVYVEPAPPVYVVPGPRPYYRPYHYGPGYYGPHNRGGGGIYFNFNRW